MRRILTLGFATVVLAVIAVTPAAARGTGFSTEQIWPGGADNWEPNVAVDPSSSYVYQMTTRYGGSKVCGQGLKHCNVIRASSNRGSTWGADHVMPAGANVTAQNDPELKVTSNGTVDAAWMNDYDVVFATSTDHGVSWSPLVNFRLQSGLHFTDKPMLAISPTGQDVYVAFNASDSYVASSHDFGKTFTISAKTNSDSLYWFAEEGAVAPNGTVFFSESAEQQSGLGPAELAVIRSTDGGATWQSSVVGTSQERPPCTTAGCTVDFYGAQNAIAVDRAGTVMVAYDANSVPDGPASMYARTSSDNGATWSAAQTVSTAGTLVGADFPQLETGPTAGDFRLAFIDDRNGSAAFNAWFTTRSGTGVWSAPVRLSNATSGAPYKSAAGFVQPYGDYLGFAVDGSGTNYLIWGEGISYTGPGGVWFTKG